MGWFWGSSDDKNSDPTKDPLRDLSPDLQAFLKKESPVKYEPTAAPPPPSQTAQAEATAAASSAPKTEEPPLVFKDGRYKDIWATYQPQSQVEAATKSDSEKVQDVLAGYKHRKAEIGRAALENCALEQWEVNECFTNGGVKARLSMCREENKSLERCVGMQQRFLKALGYLSNLEDSEEGRRMDERIQMHADRLYHQMLDQEKAVEKAKEEGKPIPRFEPLIGKIPVTAESTPSAPAVDASPKAASTAPPAVDPNSPIAKLNPSIQKQIQEKLEGLSGIERELEEKALVAEVTASREVNNNLQGIFSKEEEERRIRREEGRETIVDRVMTMLGGK